MKYILITGVSTGIGFDATRYLIEKGFFVFGSVRNTEDAMRLSARFPYNFKALEFDVRDQKAIASAKNHVQEKLANQPLYGLVNNAGIAVSGPLKYVNYEELKLQLEVNVLGVHSVTNMFAPLLGATKGFQHPPGRIINISSVSGLFASPFTGPYSISKYALESMNDVYRREFLPFGVKVVAIEPGPIKTPIWDKVKEIDLAKRFPNTDYDELLPRAHKIIEDAEKNALPVEHVSKLIYKIFSIRSPKARYMIHKNKFGFNLVRKVVPTKVIDWIIKKSIFEKGGYRPF